MQPEDKRPKYDSILADLLGAIRRSEGEDRVEELREKSRDRVNEGMKREAVLQIIGEMKWKNRIKFLALYPELIVPYNVRIRKKVKTK